MSKTYDLILLIILTIISALISLIFKANYLISTLLFFGIPAAYLTYKTKRSIKKAYLFPIVFIPLGIVIDYMNHLDKSWYVPNSLFPFRVLGTIPLENFICGYLLLFLIILFYEYFLDNGKSSIISKRMIILLFFSFSALIIFLIFFYTNPQILHIPYYFLIIGILLAFIPIILFLSFFPKLIYKFILVGAYFSPLLLLFEVISLKLGYWTFPGENYIELIQILSQTFPFEELIFWIIMTPIATLCYYKFFGKSKK